MIIIYNISGLLIGALGVFLGFLTAAALLLSGSPLWFCPGILTIAVIWCALGRAKPNFETGEMRPAHDLFHPAVLQVDRGPQLAREPQRSANP